MDLPTDSTPITLVVKAPNQRIADITVVCMLGWTVKNLKKHLADVYPNKPSEQHQKLIYSGKLLMDHLQLKDVFHQYDQGSQHTVHLVCSQIVDCPARSTHQTAESRNFHQETAPLDNTPPQPVSSPETELRHRSHNFEGFHNQSMNPMFHQQMPYMMSPMGAMTMPQAGFLYSPEQYAWMQQMYSQYMAQYMQYYQSGTYPLSVPANVPGNVLDNQVEANNAEIRPINENLRMNAQGVMDDEDDEFEQRDWLDWLYAACRFVILLSIVYFYSTISRFVVVFLTFFLLYVHQAGWFQVRRQAAGAEQNNREAQQAAQAANDVHQNENRDAQNVGTSDDSGTDHIQPQEPPHPRGLALVWLLVRTFFTSLFPQQPPAVNAN